MPPPPIGAVMETVVDGAGGPVIIHFTHQISFCPPFCLSPSSLSRIFLALLEVLGMVKVLVESLWGSQTLGCGGSWLGIVGEECRD